MNNYQYYRFFNKKGEYCNFDYDSIADKWIGRIDMQTISEGLFESEQLYILEEVFNIETNNKAYAYPHTSGSTAGTIVASFPTDTSKKHVPQIFMYNTDNAILSKYYSINPGIALGASATSIMGPSGPFPGIKECHDNDVELSSIQLNIGFGPTGEDSYKSTLTFTNTADNHVFAEITFYGEGEGEDERLRDLLMSFGQDILPSDSIIFNASEVSESNPDWRLINRKRKELLLEYQNIFPYMGSYKALINILKFYGYQNVHMKEYWKNVDMTSRNFGKYRHTDIIDLFSTTPDPVLTKLLPSKIYKKTSLFGLFYDINVVTDRFDDNGTPITEEVYHFTPEEVLIKLFALKHKLIQYYLPLNAKIVDIIGEAIFFADYKIDSVVSQNRIDAISLGIKPKYEILPGPTGLIQDLRLLQYLGAPVGPDIGASGYTQYNTYQININSGIDVQYQGQLVDLSLDFCLGPTTLIYSSMYQWKGGLFRQSQFSQSDICNTICSIINDPTGSYFGTTSVFDNYRAYTESNGQNVRIVEKNVGSVPTIDRVNASFSSSSTGFYSPTTIYPGSTGCTALNPTNVPVSFFEDAYIGYFDSTNIPVGSLNDAPGIPVGYPIVLKNKSFDIHWDNANVTYDQIDTIGPTYSTLYSQFTNSFNVVGWTSTGGTSTPIMVGVTGFPASTYPMQYNFSWDNIGYYGHIEMQWIVFKEVDENPAFYYDSGQKPIAQINSLPLVLPYVGKYTVQLRLWDLYNTQSYISDEEIINVTLPESDFIAWYAKRELDYTIETPKYEVQTDYVTPNPPLGTPPNLMTWDDYASTWELPLHPNEAIEMAEMTTNSIDSIEFYQTMENPSDNPLIDLHPFTFNLIGDLATWDDAYHLWWDNTGTRIGEFKITDTWTDSYGIGPTADGIIFMTKANSTIELSGAVDVYYDIGPTGWYGATAPSIGYNSGDIMYIGTLHKAFRSDGSVWKHIPDEMDAIVIPLGTGGTGDMFNNTLAVVKALNEIDPNEYPILSDFIYYYNETYDNTYSLVPYVYAVTKDFDSRGRHRIAYLNITGEVKSYEAVNFGYLGDIPTHFEICHIPNTSGSFNISYRDGNVRGATSYTYSIPAGITTLHDLCNELNGPTAQALPVIGDFLYNMVYGSSGWSGGTGPASQTDVKLQGVSKAFTAPQQIKVEFYDGVIGTSYGRSLVRNPTWNGIRILKYAQNLPLLTVVNFTYDNSKVKGKTNPVWKLEKLDDLTFSDIYYNNQYFSYMFTQKGSYSVTLTLTDTNGNTKTVKKQEIIKIV